MDHICSTDVSLVMRPTRSSTQTYCTLYCDIGIISRKVQKGLALRAV